MTLIQPRTTGPDSASRATALRLDRAGAVSLLVGGIAFFAYGPLHPKGTDVGDKNMQLHSMLVDTLWYPAHLVGLVGFVLIAVGLWLIGRDRLVRERVGRVLRVAQVVTAITALGQVVHLFAATQAHAIEAGETTPVVLAFMGVETFINPVWGLAMAALALRGGLTRTLGNRGLMALGVLGGLAFALVTATIAFIDTFDPLFPVAGFVGIWLVVVGIVGLVRRTPSTT